MIDRNTIESAFQTLIVELTACEHFHALESGVLSKFAYDEFLMQVFRAHVRSPKYLAFLYAVAPPGVSSQTLQHNLLEELGVEEEDGVSHPELLAQLLRSIGLDAEINQLTNKADDDLKRYTSDPLLYGTLKEIGFAVLLETVAFEYMLSRTATRIANALQKFRGLNAEQLEWFHHHSEVDIAHAEQGLDNVVRYAEWYRMSADDVQNLIEMTLRENVFIKRYFGESASAHARGM